MPAKQPVFIGTVTRDPEDNGPSVSTDIIINVSSDVYAFLGSPTLDATKLEGTTQTGPNGTFRFPKRGSTNGLTVTLITDGTTEKGYVKTFQIQLPRTCPLHVLDKFLEGVTPVGFGLVAFKAQGGIRIPIGQTVVA